MRDGMQGECDGVEEVETCNVVRACYRRLEGEFTGTAHHRSFGFENSEGTAS